MKTKTLFTALFLLSFCVQAQSTDKDLLLKFWEPLQALAETDEGILKDDSWRQKKIGFYNTPGKPFAALPSTDSPSVTCITGNCKNGIGAAKYSPLNVVYKGTFKDGYPHEEGVIINEKKDSIVTTHYEGILSGPSALRLRNDTIREFLVLKYSTGDLAKTSNFYMPQFKMYYNGIIDDFKPYKKGQLKGRGMDLEVGFNEDGRVRWAYGKINYKNGTYYKGKVYWRKNDFYPAESGELIDDKNGLRYDLTFHPNGKPNLRQMSIWKGDTVYVGPVDKNLLPHGERGYLRLKQEGGYPKTIKQGVWEHGKFMGKYGRGEGITAKEAITLRKKQKNQYYSTIINAAKKKMGINGFQKRSLYDGSPMGNTFTIKADQMGDSFIGIWVFNLSDQAQQVCIKPKFSGGSSGRKCFTLDKLIENSDNLSLNNKGIKSYAFNLPVFEEGEYTFEITKGNGRQLHVLVFPR